MSSNDSDTAKVEITIDELACQLGVGVHTVQFWLEEFSGVGFSLDEAGLISHEGVKVARLIKRFLYEEYFTIRGTKRRLRDAKFRDFSVAISREPDMFPQSEENQLGAEMETLRKKVSLAKVNALQEVTGLLQEIRLELSK